MKGLIVSGGTADDELVCALMKNGGYEIVIAADAGMEVLYRHHLTPDIIVGDFDSASAEALSSFRHNDRIEFVELSTEKDDTDTEHAVRDAIDRGADFLTILGATGSRLDHVLANIGLLSLGLDRQVQMELIDRCCRIRLIEQPLKLRKKEQYGGYVSLLPYSDEVTGVTLTGFKYGLTDHTLTGGCSLGISNELVEEEGEISLRSGRLLVIESRDDG